MSEDNNIVPDCTLICDGCQKTNTFRIYKKESYKNCSFSHFKCENTNCWKQITVCNETGCEFFNSTSRITNQKRSIKSHIKKYHVGNDKHDEKDNYENDETKESNDYVNMMKPLSEEEADYLTNDMNANDILFETPMQKTMMRRQSLVI